jgi:serine/threonine protein kinase
LTVSDNVPTVSLDSPQTISRIAGEVLSDRFRLVRELGSGSVGVVWLAEDMQLNAELVACKILREDIEQDRAMLASLKREVLLNRKLRHAHILPIYTFWEHDTHPFITMDFVDGLNLTEILMDRGKPFPLGEIISWIKQMCEALDYAHTRGILHRDIKPANILLDSDHQIRIADFGIAGTLLEHEDQEATHPTQGTLYYMSPEQLVGGRPDPRSDLYSLAATLYELLNGSPPFAEGDIISQIQLKPAPPIDHLPESINKVILKALSKQPHQRQSSCADFYNALARAAEREETGISPQSMLPVHDANRETVVLGGFNVHTRRTRLGRMLIEAGALNQLQLADALIEQKSSGDKLGDVLVRLGFLTPDDLLRTLSQQLQIPITTIHDEEIDPVVVGHLAKQDVVDMQCVPLRETQYGVLVVLADPLDMNTINRLESLYKKPVDFLVAAKADLDAALDRLYS